MKLKYLIFAKGRECGNMFSQKILSFSPLKITFWVILYQIYVVLISPVTNAAGNCNLHKLMHAGIKQNAFS